MGGVGRWWRRRRKTITLFVVVIDLDDRFRRDRATASRSSRADELQRPPDLVVVGGDTVYW
jgi:hypothetical protein